MSSRTTSQEYRRERPERLQREEVVVGRQRLQADVVGAGLEVLAGARGDLLDPAPGHQTVDDAVAAVAGEVVVGEALRAQARRVVAEVEVPADALARDAACLC